MVIRVRTDIGVFASLSKARGLGPRLQVVKKMACGLMHGQAYKNENLGYLKAVNKECFGSEALHFHLD